MALQPIIDIEQRKIFAHEALVRGLDQSPAEQIFRQINDNNRYRFDQSCRVKAVKLASSLGVTERISINFMPNAVYKPELCIRTTLQAAKQYNFPPERIIFEITEGEQVTDHEHLRSIITHYKKLGFLTALDDFGAGYAGLNLLAEIQTDLIKLDMGLVRGIHTDSARQAIVKGTLQTCNELGIRVIAEGIETRGDFETLRDFGIELFQGFLFARPTFEGISKVDWSIID